jgi:hypothetical protein
LGESDFHKLAQGAAVKLMVALLDCRAVETVAPAFVGRLVERFLHDVPENPEQARGGEASGHHQKKFLSESALHDSFV